MDLAVIAILQVSALVYGVHAVAEGRPAWLVFAKDRFELVRALDIDTRNLDNAEIEYRTPGWLKPQWIGASMPIDLQQGNEIIFESVGGGFDIYQRPNLYRSLTDMHSSMQRNARSLQALGKFNTNNAIKSTLESHPTADAWLPLRANNQDMVVLIHKKTAEIVAVVDLRPWD